MATSANITMLRHLTGESDENSSYDDELISSLFDTYGANLAAAEIWGFKAAKYADLVTVAEAGSSRNLTDLHKNALAMKNHYLALAAADGGGETPGTSTSRPRTRAITRPEPV